MDIHPACALWPRPSDEEVLKLAESIRTEGLHNPIWLCGGAILDGKTRYEACKIAGVEPTFQEYTGDEPVKFTVAQNARRRHMEVGELSLVLGALCKLPRGRQSKGLARPFDSNGDKAAGELAKEAGIGRSNVIAAKAVLQYGEPNVVEMVRTGKVGAQTAAYFVRNTPREQHRQATLDQIKQARQFRESKTITEKKKHQLMITIPHEDVINKLRPLVKRVKEQSKRHAATVSFVELSRIAHELGELADAWMKSGSESGTHSEPAPFDRVHKGR